MASCVANITDGERRHPRCLGDLHPMLIGNVHRGNPDTAPTIDFLSIALGGHHLGYGFWIDIACLELLGVLERAHHTMALHPAKTGIDQMFRYLMCRL